MLTAFLALIKDSFRAAMASRVLYVLLGIITLLLMAVAPLHTRESVEWKIEGRQHISEEVPLALKLHKGSADDASAPLKTLWTALDEETRVAIGKIAAAPDPTDAALLNAPGGDGNPFPLRMVVSNGIVNDLNALIGEGSLYQPDAWGEQLPEEAVELIERGPSRLDRIEQRRLNRLLITSALQPELAAPGSKSLEVWYGPWIWDFLTTSVSRKQANRQISETVGYIFDKFVMSVGLFIAILVTSNLIPEMFEPGSLNLLLSKPVPRWLLLLGKFVGGCAFIAVCAAYLFLGTWLWMGLAGGLWDRGLLWSIPLYIVVFAIYFSVSMLVGIWFRSAIVSVILAVIFWGVCFAIGSLWGTFHTRVQNDRIVSVFSAGDRMLAADCKQRLLGWNPKQKKWDELIGMNFAVPEQEIGIEFALYLQRMPSSRILGPVRTESNASMLVATPANFDPDGRSGGDGWKLAAVSAEAGSVARQLGPLPADTDALLQAGQHVVALSGNGSMQRLDLDKLKLKLEPPDDPAAADSRSPVSPPGSLFSSAGPEKKLAVRNDRRVAADASTASIAILNRNTLAIYGWDDSKAEFVQTQQKVLESGSPDRSMAGWVAAGGGVIAAAWGNGQISLVDSQTMQELASVRPRGDVAITRIVLANDGSNLYVLYRDGSLYRLPRDGNWSAEKLGIRGVGEIHGIDMAADGRILICHSIDRVGELDPGSGKLQSLAVPSRNWLRQLHDFVIDPFYRIAPKPGEFYKLVAHLSAKGEATRDQETDLTRIDYSPSPWSPLWSGLGFMAVILAISSFTFSRRDY